MNRHRLMSVRKRLWRRILATVLVLAVVSAMGWMAIEYSLFLYLLYVAISLLIGAVATSTLIWMLHAWRTPDSLAESRLEADGRESVYSFSLIVPARHEEAVLETTLSRMIRSDHPDFEVIVVVGADDPGTREVAERMADRHPERIRVVVDTSWPKSKPKALNAALRYCSATITGVFDAEDDVHPALLRRVDQCFQGTDADIVQAGVQLMNFRSSWFTVHNVLEYYFWFRSRLHVHARQRFIPLGGNTVFIRTSILRAVGGWVDCLAEDCEIGVRLSALGARTAVFYEPELVTREECPPTLRSFIRQRTRWNQGYLQTLGRGYWRRLPPRQRALGAYILASPYFMALAWLMIPAAIVTAVAVKAPIVITLLSFLPLLPMLSMLVVESAGLAEFCRLYGERRPSVRDYGRLVFGLLFYQAALALAAGRAVAREVRGSRGWEKTAHLGLHLGGSTGVGARSGAAAGNVLEPPRREMDALAESLVDAHQMVESQSDTLTFRAIAGPAATPRSQARSVDAHQVVESQSDTLTFRAIAGPAATPRSQARSVDAHQVVESQSDTLTFRAIAGPAETPRSQARSVGAHQVVEDQADTLIFQAIAGPAEHSSLPAQAAAGSSIDVLRSGNGHTDMGFRSIDELFGEMGATPLWARLDVRPSRPAPPAHRENYPGPVRVGTDRLTAAVRDFWHWVVTQRADLVILVVLLVVAGVVVGTNLLHWPAAQFDEGTYVSYAWALQHGRLANYTYSYGHPPLAWLLIFFWTEAGGAFGHVVFSIDHGREFMFVVCLATCPLLYFLARRLGFSRVSAAAAVVLFAVCPLGIFYHRAVLLDNPSMTFAITAFLLAWTPKRRLWAFAGSGACFALAVLCKETTLGLLPALVVAVWQNADRRTRRYCLMLFLAFFVLAGGFYPLYATLKGELLPGPGHVSLAGYLVVQLFGRQGTGSIFNHYSQGHAIVVSWLKLDPWLLGAALALTPIALVRRTTRAVALALLIQVATVFRPGYLPNMYVIGMLPFAALIVPGSIEALWRWARLLRFPVVVQAMRVVLAAAICVLVFAAAPRWTNGDRVAMSVRLDGPDRAAEQWIVDHLPRDKRIIVDDEYWIYLIENGYNDRPIRGGFFSDTVVSYWPLDYDPAVKRTFPQGWRDFDYIVVTPAIIDTLTNTPTAAAAIRHSRLVASFGRGLSTVQVRQITTTNR